MGIETKVITIVGYHLVWMGMIINHLLWRNLRVKNRFLWGVPTSIILTTDVSSYANSHSSWHFSTTWCHQGDSDDRWFIGWLQRPATPKAVICALGVVLQHVLCGLTPRNQSILNGRLALQRTMHGKVNKWAIWLR